MLVPYVQGFVHFRVASETEKRKNGEFASGEKFLARVRLTVKVIAKVFPGKTLV